MCSWGGSGLGRSVIFFHVIPCLLIFVGVNVLEMHIQQLTHVSCVFRRAQLGKKMAL